MFAIVDDDDFERLSPHSWHCSVRGYAERRAPKKDGKQQMFHMHREIIGTPEGMGTDHINGNKLDNRKENLRICSPVQNARNSVGHIDSRSGFKGVSWYKPYGKWMARIHVEGKSLFLGYFNDPVKAASAYKVAAKKHYGEFHRA